MATHYGIEEKIKSAHTRYLDMQAAYNHMPESRSVAKSLQDAYNRLDTLIQAYNNPDTPKKACAVCNTLRFERYDYVRRGRVRSDVCVRCEGNLYAKRYMQAKRESKKQLESAISSSGGRLSHLKRAQVRVALLADYKAATAALRRRIKLLMGKQDGYTLMAAQGIAYNSRTLVRVSNNLLVAKAQMGLIDSLLKDQLADVENGVMPSDINDLIKANKILLSMAEEVRGATGRLELD